METIDITLVLKKMWNKKKLFFIVWIVVFALSVLWIMPQPRYYSCSVSLAPETGGDNMGGNQFYCFFIWIEFRNTGKRCYSPPTLPRTDGVTRFSCRIVPNSN